MKKKSIDLKTLWQRAAKTRKVDSASTSTPQPVTIESEADPNAHSIEPVTIESQAQAQSQNQGTPSIELVIATNDIAREVTEPEVGSNDPDIDIASIAGHSVPSTWSPIRDGDDSEYESSDEAIYDIDLLSHDPGKRIPIKQYDVNERNSVIRGFIALGPCQPRDHNFPKRKIGGNGNTQLHNPGSATARQPPCPDSFGVFPVPIHRRRVKGREGGGKGGRRGEAEPRAVRRSSGRRGEARHAGAPTSPSSLRPIVYLDVAALPALHRLISAPPRHCIAPFADRARWKLMQQ